MPESPSWLLSREHVKEAEKSLQWLRGWTTAKSVSQEFSELQIYSQASKACVACTKQSIKCEHPKATFLDKIEEIKRKRTLKPIVLVFWLHFFYEFCPIIVWSPYIIQVLKTFGTPINANLATVISAALGISASIFLLSTVKMFGRRKLYLTSTFLVMLCSFGLSEFFKISKVTRICFLKFIQTSFEIRSKIVRNSFNFFFNFNEISHLFFYFSFFILFERFLRVLLSSFRLDIVPNTAKWIDRKVRNCATNGRWLRLFGASFDSLHAIHDKNRCLWITSYVCFRSFSVQVSNCWPFFSHASFVIKSWVFTVIRIC